MACGPFTFYGSHEIHLRLLRFQPRQQSQLGRIGAQAAFGHFGLINLGQGHSHTVVYQRFRLGGSRARLKALAAMAISGLIRRGRRCKLALVFPFGRRRFF